jgi:hypothetical protein
MKTPQEQIQAILVQKEALAKAIEKEQERHNEKMRELRGEIAKANNQLALLMRLHGKEKPQ